MPGDPRRWAILVWGGACRGFPLGASAVWLGVGRWWWILSSCCRCSLGLGCSIGGSGRLFDLAGTAAELSRLAADLSEGYPVKGAGVG